MNVELGDIVIPQYPSGSYNFIRRLRNEKEFRLPDDIASTTQAARVATTDSESVGLHAGQPGLKLDLAVIGAGVGGLAAAIALSLGGHKVAVYEQAPALGEIGAGIQIPPNSTRLLHSWGLKTALERRSVIPTALLWRRWEDGSVIGKARLNPESQQRFGSPYYVTHRAHLHHVLHQRAVELGVEIHLNKKVLRYEESIVATVVFEDGLVINPDLTVAADGLKSYARRHLNGAADSGPVGHGLGAYRATIPTAEIKADPQVSWVMDQPNLNLWVGHDRHIMSYAIAGGQQYNMVITHPTEAVEEVGSSTKPMSEILDQMRSYYADWDPSLLRLLAMVTSTVDWPINAINIPEVWTSKSGRLVLLGDSAHAMVPYMALGAAMAVEDAAALATTLEHVHSIEQLPPALDIWVKARLPRVKAMHEASFANGLVLHLPDGPVQTARDDAMHVEIENSEYRESANQWSDPVFSEWAYRHDPVAEIERLWAEQDK